MKISFYKKIALLALLAGVFASVSALPAAQHKKKHAKIKKPHGSSSSSSRSCDICGDVKEIDSDVHHCCNRIKQEINEVIQFVNTSLPCDMTQVIDHVPIVISKSGKYCVIKDLVYNGSDAAITVTADNVSINFHNNSLTLTDSQAQGVLAENVSEFTLENDVIKGASIFKTATSAAIHLAGVKKATLSNLYTLNTTKGIFIEDSSDIKVLNTHLEAHESSDLAPPTAALVAFNSADGAGIWIQGSIGVTVDGCDFESPVTDYNPNRVNVAFHVEGESENIMLTNCNFSEWFCTVNVLKVDDLLIDHCNMKASIFSSFHAIQLGDCAEGNTANDIIIRNTNIKKYPTEVVNFEGIFLVNGSGCLIENVVCDPASFQYNYTAASLHVGLAECATYSDVQVRDSVFCGFSTDAVNIESGRDVSIENCQLTAFGNGVNMSDAEGCLIKNCVINAEDIGVHLNTSGKNAIIGNQIWGAGRYGILVEDNAGNHISGNSVYSNDTGISIGSGSITEVYFNTACNNGLDCENVPSIQAQPIGMLPVAGSNICCSINNGG